MLQTNRYTIYLLENILLIRWCTDCNTEPTSVEKNTSNATVIVVCIGTSIVVFVMLLCAILLMICLRHNGKQNNIDFYFECYLNVTLIGNCLFIYFFFAGHCVGLLNMLHG